MRLLVHHHRFKRVTPGRSDIRDVIPKHGHIEVVCQHQKHTARAPVAPRVPGLVLGSVTAVASESDYAAAAAQVGALAEVLRPWVELRKQ